MPSSSTSVTSEWTAFADTWGSLDEQRSRGSLLRVVAQFCSTAQHFLSEEERGILTTEFSTAHKSRQYSHEDVLRQERSLWDLVRILNEDSPESRTAPMERHDLPVISDRALRLHLLSKDPALRRIHFVVDWLERIKFADQMHSTKANASWPATLRLLQSLRVAEHTGNPLDEHLGRLAQKTVPAMDPDVASRLGKELCETDKDEMERFHKALFVFLRCGKVDEAVQLCDQSGQSWRTACLLGVNDVNDTNSVDADEHQESESMEDGARRFLTRALCAEAAADTHAPQHEVAVFGLLGLKLEHVLPVCETLHDVLWAHLKIYLEQRVDAFIYEMRDPYFASLDYCGEPPAPTNALDINALVQGFTSHPSASIRAAAANPLIKAQCYLIAGSPEEAIHALFEPAESGTDLSMNMPLDASTTSVDFGVSGVSMASSALGVSRASFLSGANPLPADSQRAGASSAALLRIASHLALALEGLHAIERHQLSVDPLVSYIQVLSSAMLSPCVAQYCAELPRRDRIDLFVDHLSAVSESEDRKQCIQYAQKYFPDDVLVVARSAAFRVLDQGAARMLTETQPTYSHNDNAVAHSIEWLLFDPDHAIDALEHANEVLRAFFRCARRKGAEALFSLLPADIARHLGEQGEDMSHRHAQALREHQMWRAYQFAVQKFDDWTNELSNRPKDVPQTVSRSVDLSERDISTVEQLGEERRVQFLEWQQNVQVCATEAERAILDALQFEYGFLRDKVDDAGEASSTEGSDERAAKLASLRRRCIPELTMYLVRILSAHQLWRQWMRVRRRWAIAALVITAWALLTLAIMYGHSTGLQGYMKIRDFYAGHRGNQGTQPATTSADAKPTAAGKAPGVNVPASPPATATSSTPSSDLHVQLVIVLRQEASKSEEQESSLQQVLTSIVEVSRADRRLFLDVVFSGSAYQTQAATRHQIPSELASRLRIRTVDSQGAFSARANQAVKTGKAPYVIVVEDGLRFVDYNVRSVVALFSSRTDVPLIGCNALEKGSRTIQSAGLDIAIDGDSPVLVRRYAGYKRYYKRAFAPSVVDAVPKFCLVGHRERLAAYNWFDEKYNGGVLEDADLCLRIRKGGGSVMQSGALAVERIRGEPEGKGSHWEEIFKPQWLQYMRTLEFQRYRVKNVAVMWNMECGLGLVSGLTTEGFYYLMELSRLLPVRLEVSMASCEREFLAILPSYAADTMRRLARRTLPPTKHTVLVIHRDTGRYRNFRAWPHVRQPTLTIGRSMYETDKIEGHWIPQCKDDNLVQEMWLPSKFNVETFSRAGCPKKKLHVIPESIDTDLYDPDPRVNPPQLKRPPGCKFTFMSHFKFEDRKGWQILLRAFVNAFSKDDGVCLVLKTGQGNDGRIRSTASGFANEKYGAAASSKQPHIEIISRDVPFLDQPEVYASYDAFVLPSRGEGWGLPLTEAMAMQRPTIGTNWSGNTEFMNSENSYLVKVDRLVTSTQVCCGHKWAEPSVGDLERLLREVAQNSAGREQRSSRARSDIVQKFDNRVVAEQMARRIAKLTQVQFE